MKGVVKTPDGKRPHPPRMGETEGMSIEGRGREILLGMKGWRPSACRRSTPDRALYEADEFLPDVGSIGPVFFRGSSGLWPVDARARLFVLVDFVAAKFNK